MTINHGATPSGVHALSVKLAEAIREVEVFDPRNKSPMQERLRNILSQDLIERIARVASDVAHEHFVGRS